MDKGMSDEYMDAEKARDVLGRVVEESNIGYGENRDGLLDPEQTEMFIKDTDWENGVTVYREFKPTRDVIEYTVFFRAPVDGVSRTFRCDWEVDMRDLGDLANVDGMTPFIVFALKAACRMTQREQAYLYRKSGVLPAVQSAVRMEP